MSRSNGLYCSYRHDTLRKWQSTDTTITPYNIVMPILVCDDPDAIEPVRDLPGLTKYGYNRLEALLRPLIDKGLQSVLIFGVLKNLPKDNCASNADSEKAPAIQAFQILRNAFPQLLLIADVCMCSYTNTGHCGICGKDGEIDITASITRLAEMAVNYAKAGCDVIAPSAMLDGRVSAIKTALKKNGFGDKISVLSYSAKFRSVFYGLFFEASDNCLPKTSKKMYQLPPPSRGLAHRALERDIAEGADMLMVKPSLAYMDILRDAKVMFPDVPIAVYQCSGEYFILRQGGQCNAYNLKSAVMEVLTGLRRAGADIIITYFAPEILEWLEEETITLTNNNHHINHSNGH